MYVGLKLSQFTAVAIVLAGFATLSRDAFATSLAVQLACASDYYSYCSKHDPDGPGVRACMRANGARLSKSCISALVASGEVQQAEVDRRKAEAK